MKNNTLMALCAFLFVAAFTLSGCSNTQAHTDETNMSTEFAVENIRKNAAEFTENIVSALKDTNLLVLQGTNAFALHYVREIAREDDGGGDITLELGATRLFELQNVRIEVLIEPISKEIHGKWYTTDGQTGNILLDIDYDGKQVGSLTGSSIGAGYQFVWKKG